MDVILHIGAHRTASTSFQYFMRANRGALDARQIGFWGPLRTRKGLLTGVIPVRSSTVSTTRQFDLAKGRISVRLAKAREKGIRHLVVSDENMIGAVRQNLRDVHPYAGIGERMARFADAFSGYVGRVILSIRAQDSFWSSSLAFAVARGHRVPDAADLDRLVTQNRQWRDVITDLACAVPGAEIIVLPYEAYGGLPERKLALMTGVSDVPTTHAREWLNKAPDLAQLRTVLAQRGLNPAAHLPEGEGRWHPFDAAQTAALRESYADDLFWLRAGADGLATLTEETGPDMAAQPSDGQTRRGRPNGIENRRMA